LFYKGKGAIVEGNGRLELLCQLKEGNHPAPKGIRVDKDGGWHVPCVFGVDAESEEEAIAYSVSHNLSPLWGSSFTWLDQSRLFDEDALKDQLTGLYDVAPESLPIGLDGDDLRLWLDKFETPQEKTDADQQDESQGKGEQSKKEPFPKEIECVCPNCGSEFIRQL
jgi:hypothetical protein